jgi:hypothetical protein
MFLPLCKHLLYRTPSDWLTRDNAPLRVGDDAVREVKLAEQRLETTLTSTTIQQRHELLAEDYRKDTAVERVGDYVEVRICADGFLYNMVRIIVGTLTEVAYGRIDPDSISDIIDSRDRKLAGMTAPASGLYLNRVNY